jgi:hypothetical protein
MRRAGGAGVCGGSVIDIGGTRAGGESSSAANFKSSFCFFRSSICRFS